MNTHLQLQTTNVTGVSSGENVIFNNQSGNIDYADGVVTLEEPGIYIANWTVNTLFTQASAPSFAAVVNGTPHTLSTSPLLTGEVSGTAIIEVDDTAELTLQNVTAKDVLLSTEVSLQATLTVFKAHAKALADDLYFEFPMGPGSVASGAPLRFPATTTTAASFAYDSDSGTITFNQKGTYSISWMVNIGSCFDSNPSFTLTSDQGDQFKASLPVITGQLKSTETFVVTTVPTNVQLLNSSSAAVIFQHDANPAASLRVEGVSA